MQLDPIAYREECEERESRAAEQRALGNFPPYYVRRADTFASPIGHLLGKWGIFEEWSDMSSVSPSYYAIGPFWNFKTACSVALCLQNARSNLTPPNNERAKQEGTPLDVIHALII